VLNIHTYTSTHNILYVLYGFSRKAQPSGPWLLDAPAKASRAEQIVAMQYLHPFGSAKTFLVDPLPIQASQGDDEIS
jgi:hypothetical protein